MPAMLLALAGPAFAQDRSAPAPGNTAALRLLELINKNDALTSEVAQLRGQIEELQRTLKQSQELQKRVITDLDARIKALESAPAPTARRDDEALVALRGRLDQLEGSLQAVQQALSAADAPGETDAADHAFNAALQRYGAGEYQAAVDGFTDFLARFPNDPSAPDARYWMGVAQLRQQNFRSAIDLERQMIEQHPHDKRVPDAFFVVGSALLALGDVPAARKTLEELISAHPSSEAAARAGHLLKQMP
jgi:tol-pal system protein YbgF